MSPIAQSRSPARIRSSTSTVRAAGSQPDGLEAQVVEVRRAPGGHEQLVGDQLLAVAEREGEGPVGVGHAGRLGAGQHPDPLLGEDPAEQLARLRLVGREQARAVLHDRDPDAEAGEHLRQLAADRAATEDDQRAGQLGGPDGVAVRPVRRAGQPVDRRAAPAGCRC